MVWATRLVCGKEYTFEQLNRGIDLLIYRLRVSLLALSSVVIAYHLLCIGARLLASLSTIMEATSPSINLQNIFGSLLLFEDLLSGYPYDCEVIRANHRKPLSN